MKATFLAVCATALLVAGCGESPKPVSVVATNDSSSGGNPLTAPVDYLGAAGKAKQSAIKTADVAALNQAIQMFNVEKGRFPRDLNELVVENYIPRIPAAPYGTKLEYDAAAGKVKVVKQ